MAILPQRCPTEASHRQKIASASGTSHEECRTKRALKNVSAENSASPGGNDHAETGFPSGGGRCRQPIGGQTRRRRRAAPGQSPQIALSPPPRRGGPQAPPLQRRQRRDRAPRPPPPPGPGPNL